MQTTNSAVEVPGTNEINQLIDRAISLGAKVKREDRSLITRVLSLNEQDLVLGLGVFLKYLGKYPRSLEGKTWLNELEQKVQADLDKASKPEEEGWKKEFLDAFCASGFYGKLIRGKRDAKYYGDKVTLRDTNRVLVRWKLKKDLYRVLYGDLRAENVSAAKLAMLESGSPNEPAASPGRTK